MSDTTVRKKLIEVSLPLEAINAASAREKSIRHGHPSTLHLWWARRPLAACRAVLFAQLVDDPSAWPERFPTEEAQEAERRRLHKLIERHGAVGGVERRGHPERGALRDRPLDRLGPRRGAAADVDDPQGGAGTICTTNAPPVYDPFCGGGSIPLEAQRLGLRAIGSDLNPVAVMITKALVEFPPKFAGPAAGQPGGAGEARGRAALECRRVRRASPRTCATTAGGCATRPRSASAISIRRRRCRMAPEPTVIAWLWARTVRSQTRPPRARMVPLVSSFMLSTKPGKEAWVEPVSGSAHAGMAFGSR